MMDTVTPETDIFGAVQMGYVLVESERLEDWRRFLKQGLGLHLEQESETLLAFRMDAHARRLIVRRGPAEDIVAIGWQLRDADVLDIVLRRLQNRQIPVSAGSAKEAAERGVRSFLRLQGPKAQTLELFVTAEHSSTPLRMLSSSFITGASGMGHVAITSRHPEKMQRFWQEIFDARVSDHISQAMGGALLDIAFLRLNERHHSIAIAATRGLRLDPIRSKVQHLNLVVAQHADLTGAFERLHDLGFEMAHEIGQHPNDREVSFYVISPSGFEIELGWDALTVDESCWRPGRYPAISLWGHKPPKPGLLATLRLNLGNAVRALRAALTPEYSPL